MHHYRGPPSCSALCVLLTQLTQNSKVIHANVQAGCVGPRRESRLDGGYEQWSIMLMYQLHLVELDTKRPSRKLSGRLRCHRYYMHMQSIDEIHQTADILCWEKRGIGGDNDLERTNPRLQVEFAKFSGKEMMWLTR
ncbi:hypothetical protein BDR07DRAFT_959807 [Suillus spraguei]|nr:hypothetical protein BDR07DRAFT_959807 [Suillus spraguei]